MYKIKKNIKNIKTYKQLFIRLQNHDGTLYSFLDKYTSNKVYLGHIQEAVFNLFGSLACISSLSNWHPTIGNFNNADINKMASIKDIFLKSDNNDLIKIGGNCGDASDYTLINKHDDRHLLAFSSKCLSHESLRKLDIDYLEKQANKLKEFNYKVSIGLCVRDKNGTFNMVKRAKKTSNEHKILFETIEKKYILDWTDLNDAYLVFNEKYGSSNFDDIMIKYDIEKEHLIPYLHQRVIAKNTLNDIINNKKNFVWGCVCRSGKTYMCATLIDMLNKNNKCDGNYLIVLLAKNETILQFKEIFDTYKEFNDMNTIILDDAKKNYPLKESNVIICSKHFLQKKIDGPKDKSISWLRKLKIDCTFIDEGHFGGSSDLTKDIIKFYAKKRSSIVHMTATYNKVMDSYLIDRLYTWDIADIQSSKNLNEDNMNRLIKKHGSIMEKELDMYTRNTIEQQYIDIPKMEIFTWDIHNKEKQDIIEYTRNIDAGYSLKGVFLGNWDVKDVEKENESFKFQNEKQVMNLVYHIFGKPTKYGLQDNSYENFIDKISEYSCDNNSRTMDSMDKPMIMLAFLPMKNVSKISSALKSILEKHHPHFHVDGGEYSIVILNTNENGSENAKEIVNKAHKRAHDLGKKGVLVLTGTQCHLGVSFPYCDIVLLLNNSPSYDLLTQMMYRCLTSSDNKKFGFVIDLNMDRVISQIIEFGYRINNNKSVHPKKMIKYILRGNLLGLNPHNWKKEHGFNEQKNIDFISNYMYEKYSNRFASSLDNTFRKLKIDETKFNKESYMQFQSLFKNFKVKNGKITINLKANDNKKLKDGVTKIIVEDDDGKNCDKDNKNIDNENEIKDANQDAIEDNIDPFIILRPLSALLSLLTIKTKSTSLKDMYLDVEKKAELYTLLVSQINTWFNARGNNNINETDIKFIINLFITYMENDPNASEIIAQVKEMFQNNITNPYELSKVIDTYLIPQAEEQSTNAEFSTPHALRNEMLDKLGDEYFSVPRRILEPSSGKGGFILDIISRFDKGLKYMFSDDKVRYKFIVEECIYFADINPVNIFIVKLLIDRNNEYKLNYYGGDVLKLDPNMIWGIDEGFDSIIGNPPYQGTGRKKIWVNILDLSLKWLKQETGLLLFVTPQLAVNWLLGCEIAQQKVDKFYNIKYVNASDSIATNHFKNVGSDFVYYVVENSDGNASNSITKIITTQDKEYNMNLSFNSMLSLRECGLANIIINKLLKPNSNQWNRRASRIEKDTQETQDDIYKNKLIYKIKTNKIEYLYTKRTHKDFNKPKVFYPTVGDRMIKDSEGDYFPGTSFVPYIPCSNEVEVDNVVILNNSKMLSFLKKQMKTHRSPMDYVWRNLVKPMGVFDVDIKNDMDIYKLFNLTDREIEYIESQM